MKHLFPCLTAALIGLALNACTPNTTVPAGGAGDSTVVAIPDSLSADSSQMAHNDTSTNATHPNTNANARKAQVDTLVWGVDVDQSHGQIDWATAKGGGVDFAYVRATKGGSTIDSKFKANWDAAKREGIRRGAYHHFTVGEENSVQLKAFQKQFSMEPGDLAPAIRFDGKSIPNNVRINQKAAQKAIAGFLIEAEKAFKCKPVIFTEPGFADNYFVDLAATKYPLWINSPNGSTPRMPKTWSGRSWVLWTFSDAADVPGIPANLNRTKYHSTGSEFALELVCDQP